MNAHQQNIAEAAIETGEQNGVQFFDYVVRKANLKEGERDIWPVLRKLASSGIVDIWVDGVIDRFETPFAPAKEITVQIKKGPNWRAQVDGKES